MVITCVNVCSVWRGLHRASGALFLSVEDGSVRISALKSYCLMLYVILCMTLCIT